MGFPPWSLTTMDHNLAQRSLLNLYAYRNSNTSQVLQNTLGAMERQRKQWKWQRGKCNVHWDTILILILPYWLSEHTNTRYGNKPSTASQEQENQNIVAYKGIATSTWRYEGAKKEAYEIKRTTSKLLQSKCEGPGTIKYSGSCANRTTWWDWTIKRVEERSSNQCSTQSL